MFQIRSQLRFAPVLALLLLLMGCRAAAADAGGSTPELTAYFDGDITLELVAPSEVRQGESLEGLDMVMTNHGEESFDFYYSGNLVDFEVLDSPGSVIWKHLHFYVQPLATGSLDPGESMVLSETDLGYQGSWDLRDREGFPVEPGEYQVRGIVTVSLQDPAEDRRKERLETAAHAFTVHGAPLPAYAQAVVLELIAPSEVQSGGPVPMDLHITNTGDQPLTLWWHGHNQIPRPHYLDVVVFRDGERIWRAIDAHNIRGGGTVPLAPGESRVLSSLFEGYGDTWTWDQRADCGEFRFEPCDGLVAPGAYTVRGLATVSLGVTSGTERPDLVTVATEPHTLVVTP